MKPQQKSPKRIKMWLDTRKMALYIMKVLNNPRRNRKIIIPLRTRKEQYKIKYKCNWIQYHHRLFTLIRVVLRFIISSLQLPQSLPPTQEPITTLHFWLLEFSKIAFRGSLINHRYIKVYSLHSIYIYYWSKQKILPTKEPW